MPNVNTGKFEYQREIGLNLEVLPPEKKPEPEKIAEGIEDLLKETQTLVRQKPFYKIVKKDRIQAIDDYKDRCPFLELRKKIMRARVYINRAA